MASAHSLLREDFVLVTYQEALTEKCAFSLCLRLPSHLCLHSASVLAICLSSGTVLLCFISDS